MAKANIWVDRISSFSCELNFTECIIGDKYNFKREDVNDYKTYETKTRDENTRREHEIGTPDLQIFHQILKVCSFQKLITTTFQDNTIGRAISNKHPPFSNLLEKIKLTKYVEHIKKVCSIISSVCVYTRLW